MKKLLTILACLFLLAGCSNAREAASAFQDEITILRKGDTAGFFAAIKYSDHDDKFEPRADRNPLFYSIDYEILSSNEKDSKTTIVNVDITAIDFCAAYSMEYLELFNKTDFIGEAPIIASDPNDVAITKDIGNILLTLGNVYSALPDYPASSDRVQKELERTPSATIYKILQGASVPYRTTNVDVTMKKVAGEWHISMDKDLALALVGYSNKENYNFSYDNAYKLAFSSKEHSWFLETAKNIPSQDKRWKPDISFAYDILIGLALIAVIVYGVRIKKRNDKL